jgi:hypothetical protein
MAHALAVGELFYTLLIYFERIEAVFVRSRPYTCGLAQRCRRLVEW